MINNLVELKSVMEKRQTDICMLSETHVTEDIIDAEIKINKYKCYKSVSHSRHTGGVSVYRRKI